MNKENLNKEQKEKLLQLTREFFTDWASDCIDVVDINIPSSHNCRKSDDKILSTFICFYALDFDPIIEYRDDGKYHHWYIFCFTTLAEKIWSKLNKEYICDWTDNLVSNVGWTLKEDKYQNITIPMMFEHPVDFLYEFVELCKKNNYFIK